MRTWCIILCIWGMANGLKAGDQMLGIFRKNGVAASFLISKLDSLTFSGEPLSLRVHTAAATWSYEIAGIDSLVFMEPLEKVKINWKDSKVEVVNPFVDEGIEIEVEGASVVIRSATDEKDRVYELQGTSADGMCKIYSDKRYSLHLNGVSLTHTAGPAINSQSKKACTLVLVEGTDNYLADAAGYALSSVEGEDQKAAVFSEGQILFTGTGSLTVTGHNNHAICSDDYLVFEEGLGRLTVPYAANDGIHGEDYIRMEGGTISLTAAGDGIDVGEYFTMYGGSLAIEIGDFSEKQEGIKADSSLTVYAGTVEIQNTSHAGKCMKSAGSIHFHGGKFYLTNIGSYVLNSGDLSTSSAVKSGADLTVTDGDFTIINHSPAGKGLNSEGTLTLLGGTLQGTISGSAVAFTNTENEQDASSAKFLASDEAMYLLGGTVFSESSGTAGKGIVSKAALTIGNTAGGPVLNVSTTGVKLVLSNTGGNNGGNPGGNRPGGGGNPDNNTGSSPKAIKSLGDLVVYNGTVHASTQQDGGEGLESKSAMTIHGGNIEAVTYDDALNAATDITVNGGMIYAYSSGNDGFDSNGTLHFNGGLSIASGTSAPEDGFDCDQYAFVINGGILIGTGGSSGIPTSTAQKYVLFTGVSLTEGQVMRLAAGSSSTGSDNIMVYRAPRTLSRATVLLSHSALKSGTSYSLFTNATLTGGTEMFHGYYGDATATGGTSHGSSTAR